jgi:hypothetical protein
MDAKTENLFRINIVVLESGNSLLWVGESLPCDFFNTNNLSFQNIVKRIEEMERNGKISFQK